MQHLRQAREEVGHSDTSIGLVLVETDVEAAAVGFAGSPTFTVDGVDLFHTSAPTAALARS